MEGIEFEVFPIFSPTALQFPEFTRNLSIPQYKNIPMSDLLYYRVKAREFAINVPPRGMRAT